MSAYILVPMCIVKLVASSLFVDVISPNAIVVSVNELMNEGGLWTNHVMSREET